MSAATVRDVARVAKVALGTVSRVLNGEQGVDAELALRVERAMATLRYRRLRRPRQSPSAASTLAGRRLALVLLGFHRSLVDLPVVAAALHGVEAEVARAGGSLAFVDVPDPSSPPQALRDRAYDALVCKAAQQGDPLARCPRALAESLRARPLVWLLCRPLAGVGDSVDADDVAIGTMACEYLLARGHRRLAVLDPDPGHRTLERRRMAFTWRAQQAGAQLQSFVGAAPRRGLPLRPIEAGQVDALVDKLLAARPRPTALFCPADSIAALVYRALAARGLSVGRELSLVSANNETPLLAGLHPGLDTIDARAELAGRRAVAQLAWRLDHPDDPSGMTIQVAPTLVERGSVVRPRT
jgi:DNA-binding LacI/PurR family transcriptional regulator